MPCASDYCRRVHNPTYYHSPLCGYRIAHDNPSLRHAQETSHIDGCLSSVFRFNTEFQSERWLPMTLRSSSVDTTSLSFYQKNLTIMNSSSAIYSFCSIHSVQTVHVVANVFSVVTSCTPPQYWCLQNDRVLTTHLLQAVIIKFTFVAIFPVIR